MVGLRVMASVALSPAMLEHQSFASLKGKRQEMQNNASFHLQGRSLLKLPDWSIQAPINPVIIDIQDSREDSIFFSSGTTEQCNRHENMLKYLMIGSNLTKEGPNLSLLTNSTGFQSVPIDINNYPYILDEQRSYLNLESQSQSSLPSSLLDFVGNMSKSSLLTIDESGRILFSGSGSEMKDLLSILSECNLYTKSPSGTKASLLVPYFDRTRLRGRAGNDVAVLKFHTIAPLKSSETAKTKLSKKKQQNKNTIKSRDIFQKNYFQAFESLLSVLLDKKKTGTSTDTVLLLKKSGPEITHILNQFSIGVAGTGLAVLLSVVCKMAGPRVPFCATRVLNTGFGFGLFYLSYGVSALRDTIKQLFNVSRIKDEEIACKVERSMRDVLFRAGALVVLVALRFV